MLRFGPDGPGRPSRRQRVAGPAPADAGEHRLPVGRPSVPTTPPRRTPARRCPDPRPSPRPPPTYAAMSWACWPFTSIGRHHALGVRVLDPVMDQPLDRRALDTVDPILPERVIEVRARRAGRVRVGERVAGAAVLDEQLLALTRFAVGCLIAQPPRVTAIALAAMSVEIRPAVRLLTIRLRGGTLSKPSAGGSSGAPAAPATVRWRAARRRLRPLLYDGAQ